MPVRPPSPDFSIFNPDELAKIAAVLRRLQDEEEKELNRIRSFPPTPAPVKVENGVENGLEDNECTNCGQMRPCMSPADLCKTFVCSECQAARQQKLRTGEWYNGVDVMQETISVSLYLLEKVEGKTPEKTSSAPTTAAELTSPPPVVAVPKEAEPGKGKSGKKDKAAKKEDPLKKTSEKVAEAKAEEIAKTVAAIPVENRDTSGKKTKRSGSDTPSVESEKSVTFEEDEGHPSVDQQKSTAASLAQEAAAIAEKRQKAKEKCQTLPANSTEGQSRSSSPMPPMLFVSDEIGRLQAVVDNATMGPGQIIHGCEEDMKTIGLLELAIQIGADGPDRVGIIVEVKKGRKFEFWSNLGKNPGFLIYIKCYLLYPDRKGGDAFIKMKTSPTTPSKEPVFDDQVIAIMGKSVLENVKTLELQLWEKTGGLHRNNAIGTCSIDMAKLKSEEKLTGEYPIYAAHQLARDKTLGTLKRSKSTQSLDQLNRKYKSLPRSFKGAPSDSRSSTLSQK